VKKASMVPVEVVVRAYLTGSAWKAYASGLTVPGLSAPSGMRAHQRLDAPQITPTTKEAAGDHDQPVGRQEILARGLCTRDLWSRIEDRALALFARGQRLSAERGLILVDTKYEFGLFEGRLILCDEVHTPDCSRFWFADDYEAAFAAGREPRKLDKEYLRSWLAGQGFTGEGAVPVIPQEVFDETRRRYVEAFETITGRKFTFSGESFEAETQRVLSPFND
jgi:phosphoribosylaminoimidazole-succinocarboxamide synthase